MEQNPWQIAEAQVPPGQSWFTAQEPPLLLPPAHCSAVWHEPPSLIVPIRIVDRKTPEPIPPLPEKRVRVGLLHKPMWEGVEVQTVPHLPPEPQKASAVQGSPKSGPDVHTSAFSKQATSPLPLGGSRSARAHAVVSSMLAQADPGQSESESQ
jgi:hypothetical protein